VRPFFDFKNKRAKAAITRDTPTTRRPSCIVQLPYM
jgi:hypothetical protein